MIAVFLRVAVCSNTIAEIMRLINDDEIIVSPVKAAQVKTIGHATITRQVGMKQNIIIQTIRSNRVINIVVFIGIPVFGQLLWTKNKDRFITIFIIFHDSQRGKSFTKTNTVRKDAAVIVFKLINNRKYSIPLEIIEHTPDFTLLKSSCFIGQHILRDIVQELTEDMVQGHKVDKFRRILCINRADIFNHHIRDILYFFTVIPQLFKQLHILLGKWSLHTVDHVVSVVAALTSNVYCGESRHWHISCLRIFRIDGHEARHVFSGRIRLKFSLSSDPICTFPGNRTLGHLIA